MITDLLKKQEEEFDEKFIYKSCKYQPDGYSILLDKTDEEPASKTQVIAWHKQSIRELLLAQIEMVENRKKTHDPDDEVSKWNFEKKGYNQALSDIQDKLKEQLKELE